jgi:6-phosphogluconolactonase
MEIVPSEGNSPRDINFLPDNRHMIMANEFSDNNALFDYDPESGKLSYTNIYIIMPHPLAIYW